MTLPKEDKNDNQPLDFNDRHILAAMKVCGVTMEDLQPKTLTEGPKILGTDQHLIQQWYEKREQRRQRLLADVEKTAKSMQDTPQENWFPAKDRMSQACKDLFEKGKQRLQLQRKMARDNVHRIVTEKYQKEQAMQAQTVKMEEQNKKLKELEMEKQATLQAQIDKRDARKEKLNQRLSDQRQLDREKAKEFYKRIESPTPTPRNTAKMSKFTDPEFSNEQLQRKARMEQLARQKREESHKKQVELEKTIAERREQIQEEKIQNCANARMKLGKKLEEKENASLRDVQQREEAFVKAADNLKSARIRIHELQEERVGRLQTVNARWAAKHEENLQALKDTNKENLARIRKKAWEDVELAHQNKLKKQQEDKKARDGRNNLKYHFVNQQKTQIQRKDDYKHTQAMQRCNLLNDRTESMWEQKELLNKQRMEDTQDVLIDKSLMADTLISIKNANPEKVNAVLKNLGLPLMPVGGETKEGENTEVGAR